MTTSFGQGGALLPALERTLSDKRASTGWLLLGMLALLSGCYVCLRLPAHRLAGLTVLGASVVLFALALAALWYAGRRPVARPVLVLHPQASVAVTAPASAPASPRLPAAQPLPSGAAVPASAQVTPLAEGSGRLVRAEIDATPPLRTLAAVATARSPEMAAETGPATMPVITSAVTSAITPTAVVPDLALLMQAPLSELLLAAVCKDACAAHKLFRQALSQDASFLERPPSNPPAPVLAVLPVLPVNPDAQSV